MHELLKGVVLRVLRVPPEPHPPAGSPDSIRTFRASRNFYYYNLVKWGMKQVAALLGIVVFLTFTQVYRAGSQVPWASIPMPARVVDAVDEIEEEIEEDDDAFTAGRLFAAVIGSRLFVFVEIFGVLVLMVQVPVTYMVVRLDYEMRWYIVTDRSLRIREGVTSVREMTMTFANVQNLTIEQGPIQRLLKFSDLRVRTAGGGSGSEDREEGEKDSASMHIGYMRGVDNAHQIRDTILARLRRVKGSGLGDPDDDTLPEATGGTGAGRGAGDALAAAREVLAEARALRNQLG